MAVNYTQAKTRIVYIYPRVGYGPHLYVFYLCVFVSPSHGMDHFGHALGIVWASTLSVLPTVLTGNTVN